MTYVYRIYKINSDGEAGDCLGFVSIRDSEVFDVYWKMFVEGTVLLVPAGSNE